LKKKLISIITPCFNEAEGILVCYEAIKHLFATELKHYALEHIFCDNASTDNTVDLLKAVAVHDPNVKIIVNSRNFGILKNTYNGVLNATGDAVLLFMPVDLQDPPALIPEFIRHWESGYEIVYGIRAKREENFLLVAARKMYYRLLSRLTYVEYPLNVGDFQLIDKCVLNGMRQIDDARPFMRLMTFDCGFKSIGVSYTWAARKYGKSKNNLFHMFEQGLNGLISFSGAPLRAALLTGFIVATMSLLYACCVFFLTLFGFIHTQIGIPTIIIALFFFGGVQLFFLGVLGEYIYAIFNQVRRKPLVIERERVNFDREVAMINNIQEQVSSC
jgi:glycosyltransferase involved in cell wall biosynthesis